MMKKLMSKKSCKSNCYITISGVSDNQQSYYHRLERRKSSGNILNQLTSHEDKMISSGFISDIEQQNEICKILPAINDQLDDNTSRNSTNTNSLPFHTPASKLRKIITRTTEEETSAKVIDLCVNSKHNILIVVILLSTISTLLASSQHLHQSAADDNDNTPDREVTNLMIYPGFRAVKLRWRYSEPDHQGPSHAEPSSFKVRFCEIASWNVEIKCRERRLELEDQMSPVYVNHTNNNNNNNIFVRHTSHNSSSSQSSSNSSNNNQQSSTNVDPNPSVAVVSRSTRGPYLITNSDFVVRHDGAGGYTDYEAEIFDLRALTNYTFHVQVDRFKHEHLKASSHSSLLPMGRKLSTNYHDNNNIASPNSMPRHVQIETKGFGAEASKCLANLSEVIVNTGRYFGGRISVEDSNDPRCNVYGNKSSQQSSYKLTIMHDVCGSKIVNNSRIETMILVHENKDILTHNSGRFLVVCNFIQKSFTLRASVSLPKINGVATRTRPATIVATTSHNKNKNFNQNHPQYVQPASAEGVGTIPVSLGTMPGRFKHRPLAAGRSSNSEEINNKDDDAAAAGQDNSLISNRQSKEFKNNTNIVLNNGNNFINDNDIFDKTTNTLHHQRDQQQQQQDQGRFFKVREQLDRSLLMGVPTESKPIYVMSQEKIPKILETIQEPTTQETASPASSVPVVYSNNHNGNKINHRHRSLNFANSDTQQQQQQQQQQQPQDQTMLLANSQHQLEPLISNEMFSNSPALGYYPSMLIRHGLTTSPSPSPPLYPSSAVASPSTVQQHYNRSRTMRLLHHQVETPTNTINSFPQDPFERRDDYYAPNHQLPPLEQHGYHHRYDGSPEFFVPPSPPPIFRHNTDSQQRINVNEQASDHQPRVTLFDDINQHYSHNNENHQGKEEEKREIVDTSTTPATIVNKSTITTDLTPSESDINNSRNSNDTSINDSLLRWSLSTLASIAEESFTKMVNIRNKKRLQAAESNLAPIVTTKSPSTSTISPISYTMAPPKTTTTISNATNGPGLTMKNLLQRPSTTPTTSIGLELRETRPNHAPNYHRIHSVKNTDDIPSNNNNNNINDNDISIRPISLASTMPTEASRAAADLHPTKPILTPVKHQSTLEDTHINNDQMIAMTHNDDIIKNNTNHRGLRHHQQRSNEQNHFKRTMFDLSPIGNYLLYTVVIVVAGFIGCVFASLWFISSPHNLQSANRGNHFNRWSHNHDAFSIITSASDYNDFSNPISQAPPPSSTQSKSNAGFLQNERPIYTSRNEALSGATLLPQQHFNAFQFNAKNENLSKKQHQHQHRFSINNQQQVEEQLRQLETMSCNNSTTQVGPNLSKEVSNVLYDDVGKQQRPSTTHGDTDSNQILMNNHQMNKGDSLLLVNQVNLFGAESYA